MPTIATSTTTTSRAGPTASSAPQAYNISDIVVDADLAAAMVWRKPISRPRDERRRLPGTIDAGNRFGLAPQTYAYHCYPSGAYALVSTRFMFSASGSAVALTSGGYAFTYSLYTLRHNAISQGRWWLPLDAAGIAALQPAFGWTIVGISPSSGRGLLFTAPALGSGMVAINNLSLADATLGWTGSLAAPYRWQAQIITTGSSVGRLMGFALDGQLGGTYYVTGAYSYADPSGLTLFIASNGIQNSNGGATPTISIDFVILDKAGAVVSTAFTMGPYSFTNRQLNSSTSKYDSGIVTEITIPASTPGVHPFWRLIATVSGADFTPSITLNINTWSDHYGVSEGLHATTPTWRLDAGGYRPGVMIQ